MLFWSAINLTTLHLLRRRFSFRDTTKPYFATSYSSSLQNKQMPRLTGKALADDIANTVIEDSEPERQAEEVIWKKEQRREDTYRNNEQALSNARIVVADSDKDDLAKPSPPQHVDSSVIEISADTSVSSSEAPSANIPALNQMSSPSSDNLSQDHLVQCPRPLQASHINYTAHDGAPIDLTACISSANEPEPLVPRLDIARFAFVTQAGPSTVPRAVSSLSRQYSSVSSSQENTVAKPPKPIKSAATLPSFASSFTAYQLTALSKCIVCNLAWTVRKTVPVKMAHIKTCSRKNGWADETIINRLTKEIGHVSTPTSVDAVKDSKTSKRKDNNLAIQAPKTFLEDVVNEAAPKKKRKKVQDEAVVTVLNPRDAHAAILERAKSLRGPTAPSSVPQDKFDSFPATQQFAPSHLGVSATRGGVLGLAMFEDQTAPVATWIASGIVDTEHSVLPADVGKLPPSTQTCRPSALAGKFTSIKQSLRYGGEIDCCEQLGKDITSPPATQAFRQSGLATKFGQTRQSLLDLDGTDTSTSSPTVDHPIADQIQARSPKFLKSTTKPLLAVTRPRSLHDADALPISSSLNVDPVHLPMTSQRRLLRLDRRLAGISTGFQEGSDQLDPYQIVSSEPVFDQTIKGINMTEHDGVVGSINKGKQKARSCSSPSRSRSRSKSRLRQPKSRLKSRSSPKNQRAPGGDCRNDHLSDTLDEDLHRIIKEDKVLYERILRYEPIHFNVFLKLVGIQELDSRGYRLKVKLRAFLDKQAINFYGDSALASNRRRYK